MLVQVRKCTISVNSIKYLSQKGQNVEMWCETNYNNLKVALIINFFNREAFIQREFLKSCQNLIHYYPNCTVSYLQKNLAKIAMRHNQINSFFHLHSSLLAIKEIPEISEITVNLFYGFAGKIVWKIRWNYMRQKISTHKKKTQEHPTLPIPLHHSIPSLQIYFISS